MGKNCLPVICMRLVWLCLQVPCMRLMSLMWPAKKITRCWWGIGQSTTTAQNDTKSWMSSVWNSQKQGEFICLRAWLVRLFVGMGKCCEPKVTPRECSIGMWKICDTAAVWNVCSAPACCRYTLDLWTLRFSHFFFLLLHTSSSYSVALIKVTKMNKDYAKMSYSEKISIVLQCSDSPYYSFSGRVLSFSPWLFSFCVGEWIGVNITGQQGSSTDRLDVNTCHVCENEVFFVFRLSELVDPPRVVKQVSWVSTLWPEDMPDEMVPERPEVQKYCLMGVKDSFTDFHIDFGGTSVWYHVLRVSDHLYRFTFM